MRNVSEEVGLNESYSGSYTQKRGDKMTKRQATARFRTKTAAKKFQKSADPRNHTKLNKLKKKDSRGRKYSVTVREK